MMSQQQNPPAVSQSLQHQKGSEDKNTEADVKPFSIRQYVLASRHRRIFHSWPFSEKYLQMCLQCGLRDVLPPFDPQTSLAKSRKGCSRVIYSHHQDDNKVVDCCENEVLNHIVELSQTMKNERDLFSNEERFKGPSSHEEENPNCNCNGSVTLSQSPDAFTSQSSIHVHKCSTPTLASPKAVKGNKRRRRRGRTCKKRSMVDILAVARHCTLEEIYRMNKFFYTTTETGTMKGSCQHGAF